MQKNETQREIEQLQVVLRRNKEQLANTLTRIFDLEAEIRKKKRDLNKLNQPTLSIKSK
jgi:hypothetical protein